MKKILWVSVLSTVLMSGCATAPDIDYSKIDAECGKKCKSDEVECNLRFKDFPMLSFSHCKPELNSCVKACPPPGTTPVASPAKPNQTSDKPSISSRLKLLEELHKNGDITDKEYTDKRQEILNSL